jgi:S-adenosylmethionine:tRNA ribosyltransferase-isomerase
VNVSDFDFDLPENLIAQQPAAERGQSRLLALSRATGAIEHGMFEDLPRYLRRGDLLVLNDTRVFPARLLGRRVPSGGAVECLLTRDLGLGTRDLKSGAEWEALMHPGQKLKPGSLVLFERDGCRIHGEVRSRHFHGRRTIRLWTDEGRDLREAIERIGHMPLPPYIMRADEQSDRDRYQTVYARESGSVAAPTAGLHFTTRLLDALAAGGVQQTRITLHVGYGTFKPVRTDRVEDHQVDAERYVVGPEAAAALTRALTEGRRIVAVGTTTTRALESLDIEEGGTVSPALGDTTLFIHPGHRFRVVSGLVTNFHLPRSSLLMLVAAFAGRPAILSAYEEAVRARYRFYSYGDAMLIT